MTIKFIYTQNGYIGDTTEIEHYNSLADFLEEYPNLFTKEDIEYFNKNGEVETEEIIDYGESWFTYTIEKVEK